jgi:uncharacterized protein
MAEKSEKVQDPNAPVTMMEGPVNLSYTVTPGRYLSVFLRGLARGKIIGGRCPVSNKVYVPPKGASPTSGVPTEELVEVADIGTLTTYCLINIPFENQAFDLPYCAGAVLLDGADIPIFHLVRGIDVQKIRMGMRVRAVWVDPADLQPSLESIKWFEPTGEPDADRSTYASYLL